MKRKKSNCSGHVRGSGGIRIRMLPGKEGTNAPETEKQTGGGQQTESAQRNQETEDSGTKDTEAAETEQADQTGRTGNSGEDPNTADYEYVQPAGERFDIASYYNELGVDCSFKLRSTGGVVNVPDNYTTELPVPKEKYSVGFSVYYTVDEVGAMILDTMKACAEEAELSFW